MSAAPLRESLIDLVESLGHPRGWWAADALYHRARVLGHEVPPDRVQAFVAVLVRQQVLRECTEGVLGRRYTLGPGWSEWLGRQGRSKVWLGRSAERIRAEVDQAWSAEEDRIRRRLAWYRTEAGLSCSKMATALGLRKEQWWRIEQGRRPLHLWMLLRACAILDRDIGDVVQVAPLKEIP